VFRRIWFSPWRFGSVVHSPGVARHCTPAQRRRQTSHRGFPGVACTEEGCRRQIGTRLGDDSRARWLFLPMSSAYISTIRYDTMSPTA